MRSSNFASRARNAPVGSKSRSAGMMQLQALLIAALAMASVTTAEGVILRVGRGDTIQLGPLFGGRLADWYTCALLVPPLYWLTKRWPIERSNWIWATLLHFVACAVAAGLKFALYVPLRRLLEPEFQGSIVSAISGGFFGKFLFFAAVTSALHALVFYRRVGGESAKSIARHSVIDLEREATIAIPGANGTRYLPTGEVDWIEAQGNYVQIYAGPNSYLLRGTMQDFSERFGNGSFLRVHRSAIVNYSSVRVIETASNSRYRLVLRNGDTVITGRSYISSLRAWLC